MHGRYFHLLKSSSISSSLISFSACFSFEYRKATDLFELILHLATLLKLFISCRCSQVEFFGGSLNYTIISRRKPNLKIICIDESEDLQLKSPASIFNKIMEENFHNLKRERCPWIDKKPTELQTDWTRKETPPVT